MYISYYIFYLRFIYNVLYMPLYFERWHIQCKDMKNNWKNQIFVLKKVQRQRCCHRTLVR